MQDEEIMYLLCPKVGKPKVPKVDLISVCTNGLCHTARERVTCKNPYLGQTVTRALLPLFPKVRNLGHPSKPLSGPTVALFLMMARKYGFRANFSFASTGEYDPRANRFSEGTYQQVLRPLPFSLKILFLPVAKPTGHRTVRVVVVVGGLL